MHRLDRHPVGGVTSATPDWGATAVPQSRRILCLQEQPQRTAAVVLIGLDGVWGCISCDSAGWCIVKTYDAWRGSGKTARLSRQATDEIAISRTDSWEMAGPAGQGRWMFVRCASIFDEMETNREVVGFEQSRGQTCSFASVCSSAAALGS